MLMRLHKNLSQKAVAKKRKGFSFMEVLLALVLIVAMSVGAFFALNTAQQTRKMAQMNNDMDAIVNAVLTYEALAVNGQLPASLTACATGLTAEQSIDGAAHANILKWNKAKVGADTAATDASFVNPWGSAYTYSQSKRTLETQPVDADGTTKLTKVVRYF